MNNFSADDGHRLPLERGKELFDHSDWIYEPKWDGFRMLTTVRELTSIEMEHLESTT
jgi:ATP-dependent DNA ligase